MHLHQSVVDASGRNIFSDEAGDETAAFGHFIAGLQNYIPDVMLIEPKVFGDTRGFFYESFNERAFADATGDHQWIHVDVERAKAESPYRAPIAHGFLTLSLIPAMSKDNFRVQDAKLAINYGLNKVRFLSAVPVDSRIRVRSELADAAKVDDSTVNMIVKHTVEIDGVQKPAAVAEMIVRVVF